MEVKRSTKDDIVLRISLENNKFHVTKEANANNYKKDSKPYVIFDIKPFQLENSITIMQNNLLQKEYNICKFPSFYSKFIKHLILNQTNQIKDEISGFESFYKDNIDLLFSCFSDEEMKNKIIKQIFTTVFKEYDFTKNNPFIEYRKIMLKFMKVINLEEKKDFETKICEMLSSPLFREMNFYHKDEDAQEFKDQLLPIYIQVFSKIEDNKDNKDNNCFSYLISKKLNGKTEIDKLNKELESYGIDDTLIKKIDRCAWIFFSKDKQKLLEMVIPSVSIGKIIELTKKNSQNDFVKKYTEVIKGIKEKTDISKVIFVYTTDKDKQSITDYYKGKKIKMLNEIETINSQDELYLKDVNTKRCVFLDEGFYYIKYEVFKLMTYFSLNGTEIEYTINVDNFIKNYDINKTTKLKTQNLFELFKEEINTYVNSILKNSIKNYNNNDLLLKTIEDIIKSKIEFFVKLFDILKDVYSKNTEEINNEKLKKCLESDLNNNILTIDILKTDKSETFENLFLSTFNNKEQYILKYSKLLNDWEQFTKQTQNILPSIFSTLNYTMHEYLYLLFPKISFLKKMIELTVNMKHFSKNESFSTQICFFYLYIKKNFHYFCLLETLSKYAINPIDISELIKHNSTVTNNKDNNEIWNALQFIIKKNTISDITQLSAIQLISFKKFCYLAEYIDKQLALKTKEVFMIKQILLILSYLNDDTDIKKTIVDLISTNIFKSEEWIKINTFLLSISKQFNSYDEFIGKLLTVKYFDENSNKVIMKVITWKPEYLLNSKEMIGDIILSSINVLSFDKEEDFDFDKIIPKTIFQNLQGITLNNIIVQQFILIIIQNHLYLYFMKQLSINLYSSYECFLTSEQCNLYLINCTKYLFDYKDNKVKNILHLLFCIAYIKVFLYFYYKNSNTTFDFSNINSFLNSEEYEPIKKVLKIYVLKNVRKGVKSYKEFQNYNYMNNQMLWVSNLTFNDSSESIFEYNFFSNMNLEQSYIEKYDKLTKILNDLSTKIFRTNEYNEEILKVLCSYDERELFIDLIFNKIFAQLNSRNFKEESLLFYEFSSWISSILKLEAIKTIDQRVIKYYNILFNKIKQLTKFTGDDLNKLEVLLISMKMILLFFSIDKNKEIKSIAEPDNDNYEAFNTYEINKYIRLNYFNRKNVSTYMYKKDSPKWKKVISKKEIDELTNKGYVVYEENKAFPILACLKPKALHSKNIAYLKVSKKLNYIFTEDLFENISYQIVIFILYSYYYYYQKEIDSLKEEEQNSLKEVFDDIVMNLHVIGIKNEKIFMNVLYCELKKKINNLYTIGKETQFYNALKTEIETQIKDYIKNQDKYIEYMNKIMNINPSDLRNYTLDQRIPKDTKEYPYCDFFYYTQFPTLEHFKTQFNKIYNKECKYPLINDFINNKLDLFAIPKEVMEQLLQKIKENMNDDTLIERPIEKEEYSYNGQYKSLEEIIVAYSYNNIYKNDTVLPFNGDIVVYDYNGIEHELSTIFY